MDDEKRGRTATYEGKSIPAYVLDDLSSRFIINARHEEMNSIIRIFFQIETAHWFYLDFHRVENPKLKECNIKAFSYLLMNHCSILQKYVSDFDNHFESWKVYKRSIATYGAIILDTSLKHVLLCQSYSVKKVWGFPKGKINYNENPVDCAAREVFEETGFDIHPFVDPEEYFEKTSDEQINRLYIIAGIPVNTPFTPKTRREIRDIQWFPLETIFHPRAEQLLKDLVGHQCNLFLVMPYLRELRKWINNVLKGNPRKGKLLGTKAVINQKNQPVRYSKDMSLDDRSTKQGRRGLTVGQSLFANKDNQSKQTADIKPPTVDTDSFFSKSWYNFKLDVEGLVKLLPLESPAFTLSRPSHQAAIY